MNYLFIDDRIRVSTPESRQPEVLKVELVTRYPEGVLAFTRLIEQSRINVANNAPGAFDFVGHHPGMPRCQVWALSRGDIPAVAHLQDIVQRTHVALGIS